ncbi:MAG TPA: tRNA pseudouridine(38-40) synthase TruA [Planctomycetota bacterium]|jgi:tRNA pseudouridine38-40 synthase|nr:tRNA pseudouridine(38-40) synthase TruA [Planctomycetota bacterium]
MRRVLLVLEYDGAAFRGWQRQRGSRSVQEEVERAFAAATGERAAVHASGRTDAGANAHAQHAHAVTRTRLPDERLRGALNAHLPPDVVVREVRTVGEGFHARFSARRKRYLYRVVVRPVRPVLDRGRALWLKREPDLAAMRRAARGLLGRHDFRAFAAADLAPEDTVRRLFAIHVRPARGGLFFLLEGEGFLPRMVRSIVGTLLEAGSGRRSPESVEAMLRTLDRTAAGPTAPAWGLYLLGVKYPPEALGPAGVVDARPPGRDNRGEGDSDLDPRSRPA